METLHKSEIFCKDQRIADWEEAFGAEFPEAGAGADAETVTGTEA